MQVLLEQRGGGGGGGRISELVSRMAWYCNVPSEARAILEGGVPSGARGLPRA